MMILAGDLYEVALCKALLIFPSLSVWERRGRGERVTKAPKLVQFSTFGSEQRRYVAYIVLQALLIVKAKQACQHPTLSYSQGRPSSSLTSQQSKALALLRPQTGERGACPNIPTRIGRAQLSSRRGREESR